MYYVDKSRYIREVEDSSDFFSFIRPHTFGKSLFLSMLENYYDMNRREKFDAKATGVFRSQSGGS